MTDLFKKMSLMTLVAIPFMVILGNAINAIVDWSFLTTAMTIIRQILSPLNFLLDLNTLFNRVSDGLGVYAAVWVFRAGVWVFKSFNY